MTNLIEIPYHGLHTVISGGQTGSDQAGLHIAKEFSLRTGGHIANGYRTIFGPQPDLAQFNLIEHSSSAYQPRTKENAFNSDATVRMASNFNTAGEVLTLSYINAAKKPYLDILLDGEDEILKAEKLVEFLIHNNVSCLNVAGNADRDKTYGFHFTQASIILRYAFEMMLDRKLLYYF